MRLLNSSDKTAAMDYKSALDSAVAWLGDRYLLARPVQRVAQAKPYKAAPSPAVTVPRGPRSSTN